MNRNSRFVIVAASALCASLVPVASVGQTTEQEHSESILDEIADDTATKRTGSPKPVGPARQHPPSNPMPPGFHMYQELESLSLSLSSAVRACDRKAFDETKAELLAAIDRSAKLEELTDQDKTSLRVRREQAENTRFPDPCPPVTSSAPVHQPPVVRPSPAPAGTVASPASPPTLVEQARTALIEHAAAVGRCDRTKMISYLFLLDALVSKALNESMEFTGSPFTVEEERRKAVLVEIMSHRDAALKRQADCPKEPRVALNPQEQIFLDSHNAERRLVGVPPMQWDPALAAGAKAYAIKLTSAGQLVHSSREGRKDIRENLL